MNILEAMKEQCTRAYRHVSRLADEIITKKIKNLEIKGKRRRGTYIMFDKWDKTKHGEKRINRKG